MSEFQHGGSLIGLWIEDGTLWKLKAGEDEYPKAILLKPEVDPIVWDIVAAHVNGEVRIL